jgi:hypothetical protein
MSRNKKERYKRERRYGRYLLQRVLSSAEIEEMAMELRDVPSSSVWEICYKDKQGYEHSGLCCYKQEDGWRIDVTFMPYKWVWNEQTDEDMKAYGMVFDKLEDQRFRVLDDVVDALRMAFPIAKEELRKSAA